MNKRVPFNAISVLREAGLKATPRRLALLAFIADADKPLSAGMISKRMGSKLNAVTVYRALETMCRANIIKRIDFQHGHAYYELADMADHHHIVCTACAKVEDFSGCEAPRIVNKALRNSKSFAEITRHSLELFGICKSCCAK